MNNRKNTHVRHWDALGHPILGLYEMWDYYKSDGSSLDVVKRYLPHRIKVEPFITIRFTKDEPDRWIVDKVYPGGSSSTIICVGKRALEWARSVWKGHNAEWGHCMSGNFFTLKKFGRVVPLVPYVDDTKWASAERS